MASDGDSVDGGTSDMISINVRCSNDSKFSVRAGLDFTVEAFKTLITEKCDIPVVQQRLIYKGRILKDDQTLGSYGLQSDHTVHLVRGATPVATSNPDSTPGTGVGGGNLSSGLTSDGGVALGGSLFSGLGANGSPGSFSSSLFPGLDQMQQQLAQNPNMLREIMNTPVIQSLMNNPELMRSMIMSNPQMREIIERNPELGHVLNDPSTLRQTLEAARNPELMREVMRNTDRAMSNIESSPEGFNMLRRMYETVQEPLLNASTMARDSGSNPDLEPLSSLLGNARSSTGNQTQNPSTSSEATGSVAPNTNPLPNPWSTGNVQANTNPRSTARDYVRPTGIAGLGNFGLPNMDRGTTGSQDFSSLLTQIMQNPAVPQLMQSFLSNPQSVNRIRSMVESNSEIQGMVQNPEFLRQLTSPETMQQFLSFQQWLTSQYGRQTSTPQQDQSGNAIGISSPNTGLDMLMNMFGGLAVPNTSNVPPEELYATQLSQLQEMGFIDTQENIRALVATSGNVHAAVERLLGNLGQ